MRRLALPVMTGLLTGLLSGVLAYSVTTAMWSPPEQGCVSFDADTLTDSEVRGLEYAGWRGDPTDGVERLYSPACATVRK